MSKKSDIPDYIVGLPAHLSDFGQALYKERKVCEENCTVDAILGIVCSCAEEAIPDPDECWDYAMDNGGRIAEAVSAAPSNGQMVFFSAFVGRLSPDAREALWAELDRQP